jgi:flagellin-like protein
MKRVWKKNNKEAVSPVIATILMVAITVVLAAVLYVMVSAYINGDNRTLLTGSFTKETNSVTGSGNATLRLTISTPSSPQIANIETKLFDANDDQVSGANMTWKHIASNAGDSYYETGDKLQVSIWPTDLSGYKVVMTVDGFAGTIEYVFD